MSERTLILLDADGRHVIIGRHALTERDVTEARAALERIGMGGYIAELHGRYHGHHAVRLVMLVKIGQPVGDWAHTEREFHEKRAGNT